MLAALTIAALGWPAAAVADPGAQALSVGVGYGTFSIPDHSPNGTTLGVDYELGVADVLFLRVSTGGGVYFGDARSFSGHGVVGLTYHVDVLRFIPYVSVGAGGIAIGGGGIDTELHPLLELGGGLDVRHSVGFAYGVFARFESLLEQTSFVSIGARVTWRL